MPNKGTTHAYKVSRESDKITPGTSTVATFKTGFEILREFLYVSNTASSKRLYYVMEITSHPAIRLVVSEASRCLRCNSARREPPYKMAVKSAAKVEIIF